jgi:hypothetical protein
MSMASIMAAKINAWAAVGAALITTFGGILVNDWLKPSQHWLNIYEVRPAQQKTPLSRVRITSSVNSVAYSCPTQLPWLDLSLSEFPRCRFPLPLTPADQSFRVEFSGFGVGVSNKSYRLCGLETQEIAPESFGKRLTATLMLSTDSLGKNAACNPGAGAGVKVAFNID